MAGAISKESVQTRKAALNAAIAQLDGTIMDPLPAKVHALVGHALQFIDDLSFNPRSGKYFLLSACNRVCN